MRATARRQRDFESPISCEGLTVPSVAKQHKLDSLRLFVTGAYICMVWLCRFDTPLAHRGAAADCPERLASRAMDEFGPPQRVLVASDGRIRMHAIISRYSTAGACGV